MKKAATCLGLSWSTSATPSFCAGSTFSANQFHFEFIEPDGQPSVALPKRNRELPLQKNLQKKCISCTRTFTLSGSKKPQKYCPRCSRRGIARGRGLPASNPLKTKGAETRFWTLIPPGELASPVSFTTPAGDRGRIWISDRNSRKGEELYWLVNIADCPRERPFRDGVPITKNIPAHIVAIEGWSRSLRPGLGAFKGFEHRPRGVVG